MKIKNITWETDGEEVELPTEVDLPNGIEPDDDDAINDYLSAVGDGEFVEVYDTEVENFNIIDAK